MTRREDARSVPVHEPASPDFWSRKKTRTTASCDESELLPPMTRSCVVPAFSRAASDGPEEHATSVAASANGRAESVRVAWRAIMLCALI
jgi:hypothetical protein